MMSHMSTTTFVLLAIAALSTNANASTPGKAFLRTSSHLKEESMSEADVQTNLLEEVEGAFGKGSASSRVEQLKKELAPIYAALPKNEKGRLSHATVRYALHRLFVQRHGWLIRGLYDAGGHRNSTGSAGMLKEQVPAYIQDLFEKRLGGRGFGLEDLGVVAATIEHLIHNEATKRVGQAFQVHNMLPTATVSESLGDEVLDTYMTAYILGEDLSKMSLEDAIFTKGQMPDIYMSWNATKDFVRSVRHDVVRSQSTVASGELDFSLVANVAEKVSEKFGSFQHHECAEMKAKLVKIEEKGTGRVRLSDFYKPALESDGQWQFMESAAYLRQVGALDETDPAKPRVIIVNYISSPANCIASSNFYSVCCMAECEGLLGQLERHFAAPEATPDRIARRVSMLPSSSVTTPRTLSDALLSRLGEIAAENGGSVPLHGRLFSQWMHHAFPLECPYPHVSGTTNPQSSDEWLKSTGEDSTATHEEMKAHIEKANTLEVSRTDDREEIPDLPWATEEELLVVRQEEKAGEYSLLANLRNIVFFMVIVSLAYELALGKSFQKTTGILIGKEQKCFV